MNIQGVISGSSSYNALFEMLPECLKFSLFAQGACPEGKKMKILSTRGTFQKISAKSGPHFFQDEVFLSGLAF